MAWKTAAKYRHAWNLGGGEEDKRERGEYNIGGSIKG
jgi:hypothetical protein